MQPEYDFPIVAFHVQASKTVGMGHLARSSALIDSLNSLGVKTVLQLDADEKGRSEAESRGHYIFSDVSSLATVLIIDAINIPASLYDLARNFYPRILISPICDNPLIASHILVRDAPEELQKMVEPSHSQLIVDPDFAFVTAGGVSPSVKKYKRINAGICLSGADNTLDIEEIIHLIFETPYLDSISVIDRREPICKVPKGKKLFHAVPNGKPWEFFSKINFFIGGDGVMLAEAIARGIPAISLTTLERKAKNQALADSGALKAILHETIDVKSIFKLFSCREEIYKMHEAALSLNGARRSSKLSETIINIMGC
ncbi:hypothetical protein [Halomonas sp. G11]|uniref:hypothetical protein n=1 Tax=Halomonas sp. G11 TaxID=1684425 RepID=UPI000B1A2BDC|nr:hypothetical protein [Halomonas sp. G11]